MDGQLGSMIIYHHNDLDGRCSAAIMSIYAKRVLGCVSLHYKEMDYKDEINLEAIGPEDVVAILDFSFKPHIMSEIMSRAKRVIWCDHHVTAKEYGFDKLAGIRDFNDKGKSGCECTWEYCFSMWDTPNSVKLIGDYDTFRLKMQPTCFEFYEGLKLESNEPWQLMWESLLGLDEHVDSCSHELFNKIIEGGRTSIKYRDNYCEGIANKYGYETKIDGHKAFAMNVYGFGSKMFGDKFDKYPVCVAYIIDSNKVTVSLYSKTVDVSVIAKKFGGGGHKGAAGYVVENVYMHFGNRTEGGGE